MEYFVLPVFASYKWNLAVLIAALLAFHVAFVVVWRLGSIGWKRVDYVWLSFGMIGVLAGVGASRQYLAAGMLPQAELWAASEIQSVQRRIEFGTSPVTCREFTPSELVPHDTAFDRRQTDFDALCAWFRDAESATAAGLPATVPLTINDLTGRSPPAEADPWAVSALQEAIDRHNQAQATLARLRRDESLTGAEEILRIVGPFLVTLAIALRITKVSGEIGLERDRERGAPQVANETPV